MDDPTLGGSLRSGPPGDPPYQPGLDPDRPGSRRASFAPGPHRRPARWVVRVASLALVAVLAAAGALVVGSMPSRRAPGRRAHAVRGTRHARWADRLRP